MSVEDDAIRGRRRWGRDREQGVGSRNRRSNQNDRIRRRSADGEVRRRHHRGTRSAREGATSRLLTADRVIKQLAAGTDAGIKRVVEVTGNLDVLRATQADGRNGNETAGYHLENARRITESLQ